MPPQLPRPRSRARPSAAASRRQPRARADLRRSPRRHPLPAPGPRDDALRAATPAARADEDIERVRRAHRNDLENILPFFVVSFLYVLTKPSYGAAAIYFWGFLAARVLHGIFYVRGAQPHRTIAFAVGAVLMFVMLLRTLVALV